MNKWMKKLTALLCIAVLMCGMAVTAYAGGGEEWDGPAPVEALPAETVDPGEGFTEDGNLVTRDLLYDKATNKQFITVQTSGGNTFYIVIDYDKPTDEDGEQYQTYFLNMVTRLTCWRRCRRRAMSCRSVPARTNAPWVLSTQIAPSAP